MSRTVFALLFLLGGCTVADLPVFGLRRVSENLFGNIPTSEDARYTGTQQWYNCSIDDRSGKYHFVVGLGRDGQGLLSYSDATSACDSEFVKRQGKLRLGLWYPSHSGPATPAPTPPVVP